MADGDPRDYLASPLAFPEEEEDDVFWAGPEHGWVRGTPGGEMGPMIGNWGTPGGEMGPMTKPEPPPPVSAESLGEGPGPLRQLGSAALEGAKTGVKAALAIPAAPFIGAARMARPLAESALAARGEVRSMSPEERKQAGLAGTLYRAGEAGVRKFGEELEPIGQIAKQVEGGLFGERQEVPPSPPAPAEAGPADDGTTDQTIKPSRIGARIIDGKVVFTNVGVTDEEAAGYGAGVGEFREQMRTHQAGLGEPPPDRINLQGGVSKGGHFLGDPDAPLPGDEDYAEGGFVSQPHMEDPTAALSDEGWAAMTPGAKRSYLEQVGEISGARQARAAGVLAETEAKVATDPEYAARQRFGPYFTFYEMAKNDPENEIRAQAIVNEMAKENPAITEGTPEYERALRLARDDVARVWLNNKYADVAKWDDIFSRNMGLTLS